MGKSWDESNYYIGKDNMSVERINEILKFFTDKFSEYFGSENSTKFEDLINRDKKSPEEKKDLNKRFMMLDIGDALGRLHYKSRTGWIEFVLNSVYKKYAHKRILKSIQKFMRSLITYLMSLPEFKNKEFGQILFSHLKLLTLQDKASNKSDNSIKNYEIERIYGYKVPSTLQLPIPKKRDYETKFHEAYVNACEKIFDKKHMCLLFLLLNIIERKNPINLLTDYFVDMSYKEYRQVFLLIGLFMKDDIEYKETPFLDDPGFTIDPRDLQSKLGYTILGKFFELPHAHTRSCYMGPMDFSAFIDEADDYGTRLDGPMRIHPAMYKDFGVKVEPIVGENYMPGDFFCYSLTRVNYPYNEEPIYKAPYVVSYDKFAELAPQYLVDVNQQNPIFYFAENAHIVIEDLHTARFSILTKEQELADNHIDGFTCEKVKVADLRTYSFSNASLDLVFKKPVVFESGETKHIVITNLEFLPTLINLRSRYLRIGLAITKVMGNTITIQNIGSKTVDAGERFLTLITKTTPDIILEHNMDMKPLDLMKTFVHTVCNCNCNGLKQDECLEEYVHRIDDNDASEFIFRGIKFIVKNAEKKQKVKEVTTETEDGVIKGVTCAANSSPKRKNLDKDVLFVAAKKWAGVETLTHNTEEPL